MSATAVPANDLRQYEPESKLARDELAGVKAKLEHAKTVEAREELVEDFVRIVFAATWALLAHSPTRANELLRRLVEDDYLTRQGVLLTGRWRGPPGGPYTYVSPDGSWGKTLFMLPADVAPDDVLTTEAPRLEHLTLRDRIAIAGHLLTTFEPPETRASDRDNAIAIAHNALVASDPEHDAFRWSQLRAGVRSRVDAAAREERDARTAFQVLSDGLADFEDRRTVMAVDGALLACLRILCHVCAIVDRDHGNAVRASDRLLFQLLPLEKARAKFEEETETIVRSAIDRGWHDAINEVAVTARDAADSLLERALDAQDSGTFYQRLFDATPSLYAANALFEALPGELARRMANATEEKLVRVRESLLKGYLNLDGSIFERHWAKAHELMVERGRAAADEYVTQLVEWSFQWPRGLKTELLATQIEKEDDGDGGTAS
jgi:hypothetical protein